MNATALLNAVYKTVSPEMAVYALVLMFQAAIVAFADSIAYRYRYIFVLNSITLVLVAALLHLNRAMHNDARYFLALLTLAAVGGGLARFFTAKELK